VTDEHSAKTVAIIGAGIGGLYLVAELGIARFKLRLHDIDESKLSEIRARGAGDVDGERGGFAAVERATINLPSAVDGADVIIVVTGGKAVVARSLAPLLRDGQVILLIQGNTGGSLIVRRALDDAGCRAEVDVAEMDNYPYSCWRLSLWVREATLVETCQRLTYNSDGPYQATGTSKSLHHKFITEDVPTGLISVSALGKAAGMRTPAIDALVETVRNMTGKDFAAEARTLERLGLSGMDGPQIRRV
jgi:hypothetical protein